jgi:sulfate transport system ATP-binding protein
MSIEVRELSKTFGTFAALRDVSLNVATGELVALLGPSGSGKTTLLRIIAGLEQADPGSGRILFHDEDVAGQHVRERRVGFVFQHYALFRHMSVFENVAFGLRVRPKDSRPPKPEIRARVEELLSLVQLHGLAARYPSQLSGGQRQRVALARALAVEPRVLLLDEPFGALDARVRSELRAWLRRLHDEIHVTSVFVTHDQDEALEVADRVVVMNAGRIEQVGTPDEVFHQPQSEFVMNFLGHVNCFHGRIEAGRAVFGPLAYDNPGGGDGAAARLFVRPHDLVLRTQPNGQPSVKARVTRIRSVGPVVKVELRAATGECWHAEVPYEQFSAQPIAAGMDVFLNVRDARVFVEDFAI